MPISEFEDEHEHPCEEDDPSLQKDGFLSFMDPPLVAATRVRDQLSQPASSLVIQATALPSNNEDILHVATVLEELDATMGSSLPTSSLSSGTQAGLHPQQHSNTTRIEAVQIVEAVQIDELAPSQEQSLQFTEPQEDRDEKDKLCRRHWKVGLLVVFCLVVGGATGMILAIQTRINTAGTDSSSLAFTPSLRPSLAPTNAPTITFSPSFSPSCVGDWTLTWKDDTLGYNEYERFLVSPDGMSAILTYTEHRSQGEEAFFLTTLNFSELGIPTTTERFPKLEISDAVLTTDGSKLILGVSDNVYAANEIGGALWVYQRVEMTLWIPLHYHFTGGGSQGVVFSVASSNTGKVNAIVAGSFSNNIPAYVQVYSSFHDNAENLTSLGKRVVEGGAVSNTTLVGLSGNGLRLFVYTDDGIIRILDYDDVTDVATGWHPSGQSLNISASDRFRLSSLRVAESGKAFALLSSEPRSDSYLFHWNRSAWVTTVVPGLQEWNVTLQYGAFSLDGSTLVIATSGNDMGTRKVRLYELVNGAWTITHELKLPDTFGRLLGVSVDAGGSRIVVAGAQSLYVYDRVCSSVATLSPAPTTYTEFNSYAPMSLIVSSPVSTGVTGNGTDVALKPTEVSSVCKFEPDHNLTESVSGDANATLLGSQLDNATVGVEGILSAAGMSGVNSTESLSFSTGKLLSGDGSTMIVIGNDGETGDYFIDTLDLRNSSANPGRILVPYVIMSAAVSEQGERLVFGTSDASTLQNGGYFFVYRREGLEWVLEIQRSGYGGVVSVAITDDGNSTAYAALFGNQTGFVSVHRFEGGSFDIVGGILSDRWLDEFTVVRLVDERLFVASSDGFIRTYDLISNTWARIGQLVPHFFDAVFVPSKDNTILATASKNFGVVIYDLKGAHWIPGMQNMMDPLNVNSSFTTVDFSISSDGNVTVLTKMLKLPEAIGSLDLQYVLTFFERSNGYYVPTQDIELNFTSIDNDAVLAQLTSSVDLVVAIGTNLTEYRRAVSCYR